MNNEEEPKEINQRNLARGGENRLMLEETMSIDGDCLILIRSV